MLRIPDSKREAPYPLRRRVTLGIVGALALVGGVGIALVDGGTPKPVAAVTSKAPAPYSEAWLAGREQKEVIIPDGGGSWDAIRAVDPKLTGDAWETLAGQNQLADVTSYVEKQATDGSRLLQPDQTVEVPVVPPPPISPLQNQ